MNKPIILLLTGLVSIPLFGRTFRDSYEGNALTYEVVSEHEKTCMVGHNAAVNDIGDLVIPSVANDGIDDYDVIAITPYAFQGNRSITSVSISDGITDIGNGAFQDCSNLKSVDLGNTVASIGECAFKGCTVRSITVPASVIHMGKEAFCGPYGDTYLQEVNIPSLEAWMKLKFDSADSNPTYYASKLLLNGELIENLVIPEGVDTINTNTFVNCRSIISVRFPKGIKFMYPAFNNCDNIQRFDFDTLSDYLGIGYESVAAKPTYHSSGRIYVGGEPYETPEDLIWPENLKRIPPYAFAEDWYTGGKNLKRIVLPEGLEEIGEMAFGGTELSEIRVPGSVKYIGYRAFARCRNLKSIVLCDGIETIGEEAFSYCTGLSAVSVPASVETIGKKAFDYCRNLKTVSFHEPPLSIGKYAFSSYTFGNPLASDFYIANADEWCSVDITDAIMQKTGSLYVDGIKVVNLVLAPESGVVNIRCFQNVPVEKVRVTACEIKEHAFYGSHMKALCIDVERIGEKAFYSCKGLNSIYSLTNEPPIASDNTFYRYEGATLYVPVGAAERYKASEGCWRLFSKIEETDFTGIDEMFKANYDESGIDAVQKDAFGTFNPDIPLEVYDLNGTRIDIGNLDRLCPGIYIIRQENFVKKVTIK